MVKKTKLELTWIGKENRPRLEPRILIEDERFSYHSTNRHVDDHFDNVLIRGDNLLALKALEADHVGQVKCIYIDPPFNTGAAFEYYDDAVEHSTWLNMMRDRLKILMNLLSQDGVIYIHIDDKEMAYLKVLCDEVLGRKNFLNAIALKTSDPSGHKTVNPSPYSQTEYILMYAKDRGSYHYEQKYVESSYDPGYGKIILNRDEHYSKWKAAGLNEIVAASLNFESTRAARKAMGRMTFDAAVAGYALEHRDSVFQATAISNAAGRTIVDAREESKRRTDEVIQVQRDGFDDVYILNGRQVYFYSSKVREIDGELVPAKPLTNLWTDIPWNGIANEGGVEFKNGKKPEKLIQRCLEIATKPGDLVLDSFAGSGTTGAVAHKMGRRWIMVELGDHCETHIVPRLKKVIDGQDLGGITDAVGWKGGGGYRYFKLAPSLLEKDQFGQWVISKAYNPEMLAEAMCKHFGFTYAPSSEYYWMHGHSSETDFIYVTTNSLTYDQLHAISDEVGPDRTLLICCKAFQSANLDRLSNLTIRKIPGAILDRCEWGKDDYSLKIEALPLIEDDDEPEINVAPNGKSSSGQPTLFDDDEEVGA